MSKIYHIELEGKRIGTTRLEYADPPMGVVYGKVDFENIDSGRIGSLTEINKAINRAFFLNSEKKLCEVNLTSIEIDEVKY